MADKRDKPRSISGEFKRMTPDAVVRAKQNPSTLETLSRIESKAFRIRERAIAHHKAFEDRWTGKEMIRIGELQAAANRKYPGPKGVVAEVNKEEVYKLAVRQMTARLNRRLTKISEIKTRMGNAVARNTSPSLTPEFNQSIRRQRRKKMER